MTRWIRRILWTLWTLATVAALGCWLMPDRPVIPPFGYVHSHGAIALAGMRGYFLAINVKIYPCVDDLPRQRGWVLGDKLPVGGPSTNWKVAGGWSFWGIGYTRQTCRWGEMRTFAAPAWRVLALLAVPGVISLAWRTSRAVRWRRRVRKGLCPACGYDLRATPDKCPECGMSFVGSALADRLFGFSQSERQNNRSAKADPTSVTSELSSGA